jgi:hypothetical protein
MARKKTKKKPEKFIQKAIKRPGALTDKAKAAGMTIDQYAQAHKGDKGLTGQQCRFYLQTLKPLVKKKRG